MINEKIEHWRSRFITWLQTNWAHNDSAHDIHHLHKVWSNVQKICEMETAQQISLPINWMTLVTAVYFHDLVSFPKDDPRRAKSSWASAENTSDLLISEFEGFPVSEVPAIHHAIHAHSFSANVACTTIEAKILQDADRLEALGATGIARLFYTAGKMNAAIYDANDPLALQRAVDDKRFALDHIEVKLTGIPQTMQTVSGRALAEKEIAFVLAFRDKLVDEITLS